VKEIINEPQGEQMEKYLTVRQLQEQLQVDRITIYRMLNSGRLNGVKVGGQWRFHAEEVQRLFSADPVPASDPAAPQPTLPLPCLHAMQQLFSEAAGVAAVVVDPDGAPLTDFTNVCSFCNLSVASEVGHRRCAKSWAALSDGMDSAPRLHRCHAGLAYARTTIHVEGKPLAAVIAGQVIYDDEAQHGQPERLAELASACAIPLASLDAAYSSIHRLDHAGMNKMLHLLAILGVAACRIGAERQRLVAKLDKIAQITMES
jgi:excisionase family DNA binding protein